MNQRHRHWLLSEALVSAMTIYIKLIVVRNCREFANPPLISGNQKSQLDELYSYMAQVALTMLKPFLNFARTFEPQNTHNMLAIMLDPRYKGLQSVSKFVGPTDANAPQGFCSSDSTR
jgi:hypothetical protein